MVPQLDRSLHGGRHLRRDIGTRSTALFCSPYFTYRLSKQGTSFGMNEEEPDLQGWQVLGQLLL